MATRTISAAGGDWNTTGAWTEGIIPTTSDSVVATAGSGNLTVSTASDSLSVCGSCNFTNYTGTFTINANCRMTSGSLTFVSGMNVSWGSNCYIRINSGSNTTLTSAGLTLCSIYDFMNVATLTLQDNLTCGQLNLYDNGGFTATSKTINCTGFYASGLHTVNLSNSTITTGTSGWGIATITTGSLTVTGTTINCGGDFTGAAQTYPTVNMNIISGDTVQINDLNTIGNLSIQGTDSTSQCFIYHNQTVTGTFTINCTTGRVRVESASIGTSVTVTAAAVSIANCNLFGITGAGAASWDLSASSTVSDRGQNSNITFPTGVSTHFTNVNGGNISDIANWGTRIPLCQDTAVFDAAFGDSKTISFDIPQIGAIDFTGATWSTALTASFPSDITIRGNVTLISNLTLSGTAIMRFWAMTASDLWNIDMKGIAYTGDMRFTTGHASAKFTLTGDIVNTKAGSFSFYPSGPGTFDANGYNVTAYIIDITNNYGGGYTDVDMGEGNWTVTGVGAVFKLETPANQTITKGTSTLIISNTSTSNKTIYTNTQTINNVSITGGGTGLVIFYNASTYATITINAPKTVAFEGNMTHTIGGLVATGTAVNGITLKSSYTSGPAVTLSCASGIIDDCDYLTIQYCNVTGGAKWFAGANSTISNSTGWSLDTTGTKDYSKEAVSTLASVNYPSLAGSFTSTDYAEVATEDDASYDALTATGGQYAEFLFKDSGTDSNSIIKWSGKSDRACSSSATVLEIFDQTNSSWNFLVGNDTTAANTDFDLTYTLPTTDIVVSNADIYNMNMTDISTWSDNDNGTGVTSVVSFQGTSCMKMDTGGTTASRCLYNSPDVGDFATRTVFSMRIYLETAGANYDTNDFSFYAAFGTVGWTFNASFTSAGLFIDGVPGMAEVGTNLVVEDTWQEWTFDVDLTAKTTDVYLNNVLVASDVDCNNGNNGTNGTLYFRQLSGGGVTDRIAYVDWLKIGTNLSTGTYLDANNFVSCRVYQRAQ